MSSRKKTTFVIAPSLWSDNLPKDSYGCHPDLFKKSLEPGSSLKPWLKRKWQNSCGDNWFGRPFFTIPPHTCFLYCVYFTFWNVYTLCCPSHEGAGKSGTQLPYLQRLCLELSEPPVSVKSLLEHLSCLRHVHSPSPPTFWETAQSAAFFILPSVSVIHKKASTRIRRSCLSVIRNLALIESYISPIVEFQIWDPSLSKILLSGMQYVIWGR